MTRNRRERKELRELEGLMPWSEIARQLNMKPAKVKAIHDIALRKIGSRIKSLGYTSSISSPDR